MARKEFCEKDGIYISYTNNDVCFEDLTTAESILLSNNGEIIHSNFDDTKNEYFKNYLKQIYPAIISFRNFDEVETAYCQSINANILSRFYTILENIL